VASAWFVFRSSLTQSLRCKGINVRVVNAYKVALLARVASRTSLGSHNFHLNSFVRTLSARFSIVATLLFVNVLNQHCAFAVPSANKLCKNYAGDAGCVYRSSREMERIKKNVLLLSVNTDMLLIRNIQYATELKHIVWIDVAEEKYWF